MKAVMNIGFVFESLKPTLNECSPQVNEALFETYEAIVGVKFGSYDSAVVMSKFKKL